MSWDYPLKFIAMPGTGELGEKLSKKLSFFKGRVPVETSVDTVWFSSGENKAVLKDSVRGADLYILVDPYNYSVTYQMRGRNHACSPADHFAALKSVISACAGKAHRITVVMPMLYGSRQHERRGRESLNAAMTFKELQDMGVNNIVTFDLHAPMATNAVPLLGVDNLHGRREFLATYMKQGFGLENTVFIAPDSGAMNRTLSYAKNLGIDFGMFYKRRVDKTDAEHGNNAIEAHHWLGSSVDGKDCIVIDDILASGGSMLDTFRQLKRLGAKSSNAFVSFALFCNGVDAFDEAFSEGVFNRIYTTNLTYIPPALANKEWLEIVDMSALLSDFIIQLHSGLPVSELLEGPLFAAPPGEEADDVIALFGCVLAKSLEKSKEGV